MKHEEGICVCTYTCIYAYICIHTYRDGEKYTYALMHVQGIMESNCGLLHSGHF